MELAASGQNDLGRKLCAVVFSHTLAVIPLIRDNGIGVFGKLCSYRSLDCFPVLVRHAACHNVGRFRRFLRFPLRILTLRDQTRLKKLPSSVIEEYWNLDSGLE